MTEFSFQLYSARNFLPVDPVLRMLAAAGFSQVEGYPDLYADPRGLRASLDATGVTMPSGHFPLDLLETDLASVVDIAQVTGMTAIFCPYLEPADRPTEARGWHELGRRLNRLVEPLRATGLRFGWHNHDFEFLPLEDGAMPMDLLLDGGPDLCWEADIAWIAKAGADPFDWIARRGDRIRAVHVKDIAAAGAAADEDGWADIGDGSLDWPSLLSALGRTPPRLLILEHDNPSDVTRFAQRSIAALREMVRTSA